MSEAPKLRSAPLHPRPKGCLCPNSESGSQELDKSLRFLRHKFDNEQPCEILKGDVMIVVQGATDQPLHAHKFILASKSSVLCQMLDTNMFRKVTGVFRIDDATLPVMRAVVKFCYDAEIEFTNEVSSEEVLKVAHKYAIHHLKEKCEEHLMKAVDEGNLPKMLQLARRFDAKDLEEAASHFFRENFDRVIRDVLSEFR